MKKNYPSAELQPLTETERTVLANAVIGHGNMVKAVGIAGVSDVTIRRAIAGFKLNPDTRKGINKLLNTHYQPDPA